MGKCVQPDLSDHRGRCRVVVSAFGETSRMSKLTRRMALIGLSTFVASPVGAQTSQTGKPTADSSEIATLEKSAVFEMNPNSGSLKESIQKGQELIWHRKENPNDVRFKLTNISLALLRNESVGQLKMSFSCNISSLGYFTPDEAKLNIIIRAKGGAVLHTWSVGVLVKCTNKDQPLTPLIHEVPSDLAPNVFTNVNACEITEHTEPNYPGVKVQRCS